jgi:hypothetical protein
VDPKLPRGLRVVDVVVHCKAETHPPLVQRIGDAVDDEVCCERRADAVDAHAEHIIGVICERACAHRRRSAM